MEKKNDTEIHFKPLTEGLGFHPFSDGLPYAPVSKNAEIRKPNFSQPVVKPPLTPHPSKILGMGAIAAGPAVFPKKVAVPVVSPSRSLMPQALAETRVEPKSRIPIVDQHFGFVYLLKRVFSFLLDSFLGLAACGTALSSVLLRQDITPETFFTPSVLFLIGLFSFFFNWALICAEEVAFGTTIGKRFFGLGIQGSPSAIFLRSFFFLPSIGFCGIGIIWALFNSKRRCWHDVVVDLQPIEISKR